MCSTKYMFLYKVESKFSDKELIKNISIEFLKYNYIITKNIKN